MKVYLMHRDKDFDPEAPLPSNEKALIQDLELETLFQSMSKGDRFLYDIAKKALLIGLRDEDSILYRQQIVEDCLQNAAIIKEIYAIAVECIETKRKNWFGIFNSYPGAILYSSVKMLEMYLPLLDRLRKLAYGQGKTFTSEGFNRFFSMLQQELDDDYFAILRSNLKQLNFHDGVLISAQLGNGNEGIGHVLRKPNASSKRFVGRLLTPRLKSYNFSISPRDDGGCRALGELKARGVNLISNALAQSADNIDSFFKLLQTEMAFYVCCLNLHDDLARIEEPICFPTPSVPGKGNCEFNGLYDVCLALFTKKRAVGDDLRANGKDLVVITGVNQGGKSTFLRSVGLGQLIMQSGMFVPATSFNVDICDGIFTHHRRKEDRDMKSGKFDEELGRMSEIVNQIKPNSLMLFNESFAATNEREGSEIARQIVTALIERGIKVFFVTHLYSFAHRFLKTSKDQVILLRAERQQDGNRTFKIVEGPPSPKSYGEDLYYKIFAKN